MDFINLRTMHNSKCEAAAIQSLQAQDFVVNKPAVKNQPVYYLSVRLKDSISRTAYIQVKTRGSTTPQATA